MAELSHAFNSPSPYQPTQVLSYTTEELLQKGYLAIPYGTQEEAKLCLKINAVVETIKEFYWMNFQLIGVNVDKEGAIPPFFIHYPKENAYYAPKLKHFAFDNQFASRPDIVCHEMTHALIAYHNPLQYKGESGALDEAIADVAAIAFKQYKNTSPNDWQIGNLRNLSNIPEKFKFSTTYNLGNDFGYVHDNSLIISYTFYLASKNLSHDSTHCKLLFNIWFKSMLALGDKSFKGFRAKTIKVANEDIHTVGRIVINGISDAWEQTSPLFP
ncbi:Uncharacterized protein PRO82_000556 [Candidatus Protochlamydia amoebophila]|uniref:M4 family metallopeptidase n=1 Tax=Candidatus Protochlamydia amoebophila TaxID=362787 RepID=UPI001BC9037F|nr:M4 family metallopeptidase [Candidatus Protochlamydia amoebophila]MBS4163256.1 Uncharacterized protein [Candidatus Protochlamydia amoebophila]